MNPGYTSMTNNQWETDQNQNFEMFTDEDEDDLPCEYGCGASPECCQRSRNPQCILVFLSISSFVQGLAINGFVNSSITTIERRYNLTSTDTGIMAAIYDIAVVICILPVSYFGGRGRKGRWVGIGMGIMGIGCLIYASPQAYSGKYEASIPKAPLCNKTIYDTNYKTLCESVETEALVKLNNYKYIFWLAQFINGIGCSPLYTIGFNFLDENLNAESSALYIGIFSTMALIGPAMGFLTGGAFLKIYVDVVNDNPRLTPETLNAWVGAWWLGFVISAVLIFTVVIPLVGFPHFLPGAKKNQAGRTVEFNRNIIPQDDSNYNKISEPDGYNTVFDDVSPKIDFSVNKKELKLSLKSLGKNLSYVFLTFAGASESFVVSIFALYGPKYLETAFTVTADWAPMLVGLCTVPVGGVAVFLGGLVIRLTKMTLKRILLMCWIISIVCVPLTFLFFFKCDTPYYAGINSPYANETEPYSLNSTCAFGCSCTTDFFNFEPVCAANTTTTYFSPCHAGCEKFYDDPVTLTRIYSDCQCSNIGSNVISGSCTKTCETKNGFLLILSCFIFCTFFLNAPTLSATLRIVEPKDRTISVGIQSIVLRVFGAIPGPLIAGALIDYACAGWLNVCTTKGSCFYYHPEQFRLTFFAISFGFKMLSCIFFTLAYFFYKPPPIVKFDNDQAPQKINENSQNSDSDLKSTTL